MLSTMGRNAFFCCQRFSVLVDDVLHLSAAGVARHCQNEVTAKSITLAVVSKFYVSDMEVTVLNLKTVLLLTILTVSVDTDVLDVF